MHDFLFTYYSVRPNQLRRWHPGFGAALAGDAAADYLEYAGYTATERGVTVSPTSSNTDARPSSTSPRCCPRPRSDART